MELRNGLFILGTSIGEGGRERNWTTDRNLVCSATHSQSKGNYSVVVAGSARAWSY